MKALMTAVVMMFVGPAALATNLECGVSMNGRLPQEIVKPVSPVPGEKATYELATYEAGTPRETKVFVEVTSYGSNNIPAASSNVYATVNGLYLSGRGSLLLYTPGVSPLDVHCSIENFGQLSPSPVMDPGPTVE